MNCPKCGKEQLCWCENCANWGKIVQRVLRDDIIACGHCGHTMHIDGWGELEIEQLFEAEGVATFAELQTKRDTDAGDGG